MDGLQDVPDRLFEAPVIRLTLASLAGGFALIGLGVAGLGGSVLAVGVLAGVAGALYGAGRALEPYLDRIDDNGVTLDIWTGPAVGALVALVWFDATAAELQALGGLLGLVGMANYFLRPVYHLVYGLGRRVSKLVT